MANRFTNKLARFASLSDEDIAVLSAATARTRTVPARHDPILEGDVPGPVFVILEGWACRYKILPEGGRQIMAFLMPGDTCDIQIGSLEVMDHSIKTLTLLHGLIEKRALTIDEAVVIVDSAAEVKAEIAADLGDTPEALQKSLSLLNSIAESLRHDLDGR